MLGSSDRGQLKNGYQVEQFRFSSRRNRRRGKSLARTRIYDPLAKRVLARVLHKLCKTLAKTIAPKWIINPRANKLDLESDPRHCSPIRSCEPLCYCSAGVVRNFRWSNLPLLVQPNGRRRPSAFFLRFPCKGCSTHTHVNTESAPDRACASDM